MGNKQANKQNYVEDLSAGESVDNTAGNELEHIDCGPSLADIETTAPSTSPNQEARSRRSLDSLCQNNEQIPQTSSASLNQNQGPSSLNSEQILEETIPSENEPPKVPGSGNPKKGVPPGRPRPKQVVDGLVTEDTSKSKVRTACVTPDGCEDLPPKGQKNGQKKDKSKKSPSPSPSSNEEKKKCKCPPKKAPAPAPAPSPNAEKKKCPPKKAPAPAPSPSPSPNAEKKKCKKKPAPEKKAPSRKKSNGGGGGDKPKKKCAKKNGQPTRKSSRIANQKKNKNQSSSKSKPKNKSKPKKSSNSKPNAGQKRKKCSKSKSNSNNNPAKKPKNKSRPKTPKKKRSAPPPKRNSKPKHAPKRKANNSKPGCNKKPKSSNNGNSRSKPKSNNNGNSRSKPKKSKPKANNNNGPKPKPCICKKPANAYLLFASELREDEDLQDEHILELGRLAGERWRNMTQNEKKPYFDQYQKNLRRYQEQQGRK